MPFLDHLEELRWRIFKAAIALFLGTVVGFVVVQNFDMLGLLKQPIAPYLPEGNLIVTRPTDAFFVTLKLALLFGFVLAAPIIFAQVWSFLSPALKAHERRYIVPALIAGVGLFVAGALMAYLWVLPAALRILLTTFQRDDLEFFITATAYFSFATQLIVAFGIMFELPVFMVLLSAIGLIGPATFAKHRPFALVIAAILAAMLTPPDVLSMLMLMLPVVVLYEVGIAIGRIVWRQSAKRTIGRAALVLFAIGVGAGSLEAQEPRPQRRDTSTVRPDSLMADSLRQAVDSATAAQLGLPTQPSRSFPVADSTISALMRRAGYGVTRYASDSLTLLAATSEILLSGRAMVEREGSILEADSIDFLQNDCLLLARGDPALFDDETVLVGAGMRYDTCEYRGIIAEALTKFDQQGITWYMRGDLAVDSASTRIYGEGSDVTTCDLPQAHYHFAVHNVKWVSNTILVARPAILYVQDVPVLWLPFIFQDMRPGRRSGILIPRFGINDLVRPNAGYRRHVSNVGYYFAINDYVDLQASLDWFSGSYTAINGQVRYRWLDRFVSGSLAFSQIFEADLEGDPGGRSMRIQWTHQQSFNQRTRLNANVDYATSSRIIERNAIDPLVQTATLGSRVNFNKRYDWGTVTAGLTRTQDLSNNTITQTLPSLSLSPSPINIGRSFTWSPSISFTRSERLNQLPGIPISATAGGTLADTLFPSQRDMTLRVATPMRIGRWNWQNDFTVRNFATDRPPPPDIITDPTDSSVVSTVLYGEDFSTTVDWNTGINLPILFSSTFKLQPTLGIANKTSGPFLIRNRFTGGSFVQQGKRVSFGASISPVLFGFFPGFAGLSRIRHSFSPRVSWNIQPAADVPEAYARAIAGPGQTPQLRSPTLHSLTFSIANTFEGKNRLAPEDSTTDPRQAPKVKLLNIRTSAITYDFEQAKLEGRNGWRTQTLSNSFTSDLLRGFTLSLAHDLWDGPVGFDTTDFDPFLRSASARFSLTGATISNILSLFVGGNTRDEPEDDELSDNPEDLLQPEGTGLGPPRGLDPAINRLGARRRSGGGFRASISYDEQRFRDQETADSVISTPANRNLGLQLSFSPTQAWSVSWNTNYDLTNKKFGQHIVRLDRDLHRWRATFSFVQAPNGNFAFNFFISLTDQPEIKFQYDQRTVREGR